MFEVELDLEHVAANLSPENAKMFGIERAFHPTVDHARIVRGALTQQGYGNPRQYLLRGGFFAKEDFDLLVKKGTDYYGRSNGGSTRYSTKGTFVSSVDDIGGRDYRLDPLWTALRSWNDVHVIAVYDAMQLKVVRPDYKEYEFKYPRRKPQALLGILHLKFKAKNQ